MSSKSAVKTVARDGGLFRLVAILTGSKRTERRQLLHRRRIAVVDRLRSHPVVNGWGAGDHGAPALHECRHQEGQKEGTLRSILSKSSEINRLRQQDSSSSARDIWFVVALPYFANELDWAHEAVGAFLALWVIGYAVQSSTPGY